MCSKGKIEKPCLLCSKPTQNEKYCSWDCQHASQIKRIVRSCKYCSKEFNVSPCIVARGEGHGRFCSKPCRGAFIRKPKQVREKIPKPTKKTNDCKNCGEKCIKMFCNESCYHAHRRKTKGSSNVTINCKNCGRERQVLASQYNLGYGRYCNHSCWSQYRAKNENMYSNSKGGKREDLNNMYFRSSWEANYARVLNYIKDRGEIQSWEYEPETFVFHNIKRGTTSYLPDFKITYPDGRIEYVEIKGFMDTRSKTKLNRMAKYYPNATIVLIQNKEYQRLCQEYSNKVNWEFGRKGY